MLPTAACKCDKIYKELKSSMSISELHKLFRLDPSNEVNTKRRIWKSCAVVVWLTSVSLFYSVSGGTTWEETPGYQVKENCSQSQREFNIQMN